MKHISIRIFALLSILLLSTDIYCQSSGGSSNYLIWSLVAVGFIILIGAIISLSDNLLNVEASKQGLDTSDGDYGVFPSISNLFVGKVPTFASKKTYHKLSKGFTINLLGEATDVDHQRSVQRFAISPKDFIEMSPIPKVEVEVGQEVKAGDVIFFDKKRPEIKYVSPVSGEVIEINRAEKRSIDTIVILADKDNAYTQHEVPSINESSREDLVTYLAASGGWTMINQRPFDIVPALDGVPTNVFISTFDSAPLAPNYEAIAAENKLAIQNAINTLNRLTEGKVYLGLDAKADDAANSVFNSFENAEIHWFDGKHPYGNVGVQIHHIAPIANGTNVWTLSVNDLITLGHLMTSGEYRTERHVVLAGAGMKSNAIVKTYQGAHIGDLTKGLIKENSRVISGNVLTGKQVTEDNFLRFRDNQITAITEGDSYELFGWLLPLAPRPSLSRTFPSFLMPNFQFEGETNMHGEGRAFVVTGQYESVLPMDIYPQHLMKAIMAGDFERMEGLGINELSEEDLALCEFVCTSKQPLQSILREGLEMMREQL